MCTAIFSAIVHAQDTVAAVEKPIDQQRVLGVLPNFRTADGSQPFSPITPKQKMTIAMKDSFDGPVYLIAGAFASLYQLEDQNPSYGQGMKGYAKRYGSAYGDQEIGRAHV